MLLEIELDTSERIATKILFLVLRNSFDKLTRSVVFTTIRAKDLVVKY